jgi:hypothetical protein
LCEKMDYKISLNKEILEWRKLCYEQSDKIQHYKSLITRKVNVTPHKEDTTFAKEDVNINPHFLFLVQ